MKWNKIKITIKKEFKTIIRDKKYILLIVLSPLIIPAFMIIFGLIFENMSSSTYYVGVNYDIDNNHESIISSINEENETIKLIKYSSIKELENAYNNYDISAYIVKSENKYTVFYDETNTNSMTSGQISLQYLSGYNNYLGNNYLIGQDIDPSNVFEAIEIDYDLLNDENTDSLSAELFQTALSYVIMIIVLSAVSISTDITAGEKERGTLETLLTFPTSCKEIIAGKFLSISLISLLTGLIGYLLGIITINFIGDLFPTFNSISFSAPMLNVIISILIIILSSLLISAFCLIICGKAKNFKEAQSSLSPLTFICLVPMFIIITGVHTSPLLSLIPVVNCGLLLNDIFFNGINWTNLLIMFSSTIIYILIAIFYVSKQYSDEKTLF